MIQIQIATRLTAEGVGDIRWVLLEPSEPEPVDRAESAGQGAQTISAPAASASVDTVEPPATRSPRRAPLAVAILAALVAAWWLASSVLDRPHIDPSGASAVTAKR